MAAVERRPWTLVSVHVPKTAGTSIAEALRRVYGDSLRADNSDRPLAHTRAERRLAALRHVCATAGRTLADGCVHGHFMPLKYALARDARFCIWLRDPVQRVVSRYHHYRRHGHAEPQHLRRGLVPGLSLEQFAVLPQYRNTYAEYLWGFPLRRFDFIGIVERYEQEVERFARCFGFEPEQLTGIRSNCNPERQAGEYRLAPAQESLIRRCNARDLALYERALRLRQ